MEAQRQSLRARFAERLFALRGVSHLDVGAGEGELVRAARAHGLRSFGLEPLPRAAPAGVRRAWVRADADHLPCGDASVDWVTLRHVPHHLPDLRAALAEAYRVARAGLLLAEPWFDERLTDQRFALRADRWLKRQDRRHGRFHADALSGEELLAALGPRAARTRVETYRPTRAWSAADLAREAREARGDLPLAPEDERELENLLEIARRGRLTLPGTLILTIEKG